MHPTTGSPEPRPRSASFHHALKGIQDVDFSVLGPGNKVEIASGFSPQKRTVSKSALLSFFGAFKREGSWTVFRWKIDFFLGGGGDLPFLFEGPLGSSSRSTGTKKDGTIYQSSSCRRLGWQRIQATSLWKWPHQGVNKYENSKAAVCPGSFFKNWVSDQRGDMNTVPFSRNFTIPKKRKTKDLQQSFNAWSIVFSCF